MTSMMDTPKALGCIVTKPGESGRHVYQADDDGRRIDEIADGLLAPMRLFKPRLLVIEAPAGAQHAASAKALGASYAVSRTLGRALGIPAMTVQAFEPLKLFLGRRQATKLDIEEWCLRQYPDTEWMLPRPAEWTGRRGVPKPIREGCFDALSVALCGAQSSIAGALRDRGDASVIMGLDGSMTAFGWAVVELGPPGGAWVSGQWVPA